MDDFFNRLCTEFSLKGEMKDCEAIKSGNINDTYVVTTASRSGDRNYLVQKVNTAVFKDPEHLIDNAVLVTEYIHRKLLEEGDPDSKRKYVKYYKDKNGNYLHFDEEGRCWRVMSYIYNARSYDTADSVILHSTGVAFGRFQRQLDGFPAEKLKITIPNFHNTEMRYEKLEEAAEADAFGRLDSCREIYDFLMENRDFSRYLSDKVAAGEIPLRVTHNDTKCNNVMFDIKSGLPLAVIDLDTVMPGLMGHDFGDAVRFAANTAAEDEADLSLVSLDIDKFTCFASGFLPEVKDMITEAELDTLSGSVLLITLELAARFLTDYLCGDVYFKVSKPCHNLYRAACQAALAADIKQKLPVMREIVVGLASKL